MSIVTGEGRVAPIADSASSRSRPLRVNASTLRDSGGNGGDHEPRFSLGRSTGSRLALVQPRRAHSLDRSSIGAHDMYVHMLKEIDAQQRRPSGGSVFSPNDQRLTRHIHSRNNSRTGSPRLDYARDSRSSTLDRGTPLPRRHSTGTVSDLRLEALGLRQQFRGHDASPAVSSRNSALADWDTNAGKGSRSVTFKEPVHELIPYDPDDDDDGNLFSHSLCYILAYGLIFVPMYLMHMGRQMKQRNTKVFTEQKYDPFVRRVSATHNNEHKYTAESVNKIDFEGKRKREMNLERKALSDGHLTVKGNNAAVWNQKIGARKSIKPTPINKDSDNSPQ